MTKEVYATTGDTIDFFYRHDEKKKTDKELFYPIETQWREKTIEDFKTATEGVFKAKLK